MPDITKRHRALDAVPEIEWTSASARARVLAPLAQLKNCRIEDIDDAAAQLNVSRATAYRLLARQAKSGDYVSLAGNARLEGRHIKVERHSGDDYP